MWRVKLPKPVCGLLVVVAMLPGAATAAAQSEDAWSIPPLSQPLPDDSGISDVLPEWDWAVAALVQQDALLHSDQPEELEEDVELRRARIAGIVSWQQDWRFRAGVDFANDVELRELLFEYRYEVMHFSFGRVVEPFGLLQGNASGAALMERPQAGGLAPGYGLGANFNYRGETWGFTGGLFSATRNDVLFGGRKENAITARYTVAPWRGDDGLLHLGAAVSLRESDDQILRFVAIPETVLLRGLNASSGILAGRRPGYQLYGAEIAGLLGPVLLQAEVLGARLDEVVSVESVMNEDFRFHRPRYGGAYVEASWVITGERRDYSIRRGLFSGIEPESSLRYGGIGAFELAARYSGIDLRDRALGGDEGRVASVALAWHPDAMAKLVLEGLHITEENNQGREEAYAVQLRAQVYFGLP